VVVILASTEFVTKSRFKLEIHNLSTIGAMQSNNNNNNQKINKPRSNNNTNKTSIWLFGIKESIALSFGDKLSC